MKRAFASSKGQDADEMNEIFKEFIAAIRNSFQESFLLDQAPTSSSKRPLIPAVRMSSGSNRIPVERSRVAQPPESPLQTRTSSHQPLFLKAPNLNFKSPKDNGPFRSTSGREAEPRTPHAMTSRNASTSSPTKRSMASVGGGYNPVDELFGDALTGKRTRPGQVLPRTPAKLKAEAATEDDVSQCWADLAQIQTHDLPLNWDASVDFAPEPAKALSIAETKPLPPTPDRFKSTTMRQVPESIFHPRASFPSALTHPSYVSSTY